MGFKCNGHISSMSPAGNDEQGGMQNQSLEFLPHSFKFADKKAIPGVLRLEKSQIRAVASESVR